MSRNSESSLVKETLKISQGVAVFSGLAIYLPINDAFQNIKHWYYHKRDIPHKKVGNDILTYFKRV